MGYICRRLSSSLLICKVTAALAAAPEALRATQRLQLAPIVPKRVIGVRGFDEHLQRQQQPTRARHATLGGGAIDRRRSRGR